MLSKKEKQKILFRSIINAAEQEDEKIMSLGNKYKSISLDIETNALEEIKNWGRVMDFKKSTQITLKRIMRDLNFEATKYDFESEEYEFLMNIIGQIEDEIK